MKAPNSKEEPRQPRNPLEWARWVPLALLALVFCVAVIIGARIILVPMLCSLALAYLLQQHGMSFKDVSLTDLQPPDAAAAFIAGQFDVAVTYEPYLSNIRKDPNGKILVTSADTPGVIIDTLAFQPDYVAAHPDVVKGVVDSWFEALDYIKANPAEANRGEGA